VKLSILLTVYRYWYTVSLTSVFSEYYFINGLENILWSARWFTGVQRILSSQVFVFFLHLEILVVQMNINLLKENVVQCVV